MKLASIEELRRKNKFVFALIGNPNVGKSSIFNQLTGFSVETANYPGKTVEINAASTRLDEINIGLVDLPGVYALGGISEDQWVARQALLEEELNVVIVILDATNLARNLYLLLQLIDLDFPVIAALNLIDLSGKQGINIECEELEKWLGIKVVKTVAIRGEGLSELLKEATSLAVDKERKTQRFLLYEADIEEEIFSLSAEFEKIKEKLPFNLSPRGWAILVLEQDQQFLKLLEEEFFGSELLNKIKLSQEKISYTHGQDSPMRIAIERHGLAGSIANVCEKKEKISISRDFTHKLWNYATGKIWGFAFLILCLAFIFGVLFYLGGFLSKVLSEGWVRFVSPSLNKFLEAIFNESLAKIIAWGLDDGILSVLAVGVSYVLVFYFLLAFLEDTGYITALAFLVDKFMHKIGLHGRAVISLVAGLGCNVPAIIGTRVLTTLREKIIASFLITLVPCGARISIVMGAVSLFLGPLWALVIFLISFLLIIFSGFFLNKILPEKSSGLVMEVFSFRVPDFANILKKTWHRLKGFIFMAAPIVVVGSIILGIFYQTGWIWKLTPFMSPVIEGWLGLPPVCGLALLFAILRKELALQLLLSLAIIQYGKSIDSLPLFMTKKQIFVYTLVSVIYVPCIATISAIVKELGLKRAIYISLATIILAVLVGGIANQILEVGQAI